jgi:serine/threonine-protein kinase PpkA
MFCDKCGTENRDTAGFCSNCGSKISDITDEKTPKPPQNQAPKPSSFIDRFKDAVSERYEIVRELGRGGMAIVFLAKDKRLEREVALKLLPEEFHHDENFRTRFIREARVSAKLSHPNIIQIHDVNEKGDFTFFSMSYIEGLPLADIIKKGEPIDPKIISRLAIHVCFALQQAHEKNVIHRDIKPENILINKKKMPIVVDFGIAKALSEAKLSQTGMLIGTPHYMSPEQIKTGNVDGRSDLYSLGILLYEMAVGQTPFKGLDPTSLMYHQVNEVPAAPHEVNDKIPQAFSDLIMKTLEKNPDDRYQTAAELGKALHQYMQGADTNAPKSGAGKKKAASAAAAKKAPDDAGGTGTIIAPSSANASGGSEEEHGDSIGDTLVDAQVPGKKKSAPREKDDEESKGGIGVLAGVVGVVSALIIAGLLGMQFLKNDDVPISDAPPARQQAAEKNEPAQETNAPAAPAPDTNASKPAEPSPVQSRPVESAPTANRPVRETAPEPVRTEPEPQPVVNRPAPRRVEEAPVRTVPVESRTTARTAQPAPQTTQTAALPPDPVQESARPAPVREEPAVTQTAQRQIASVPKPRPEPERAEPVKVPERTVETVPKPPVRTVASITWMKIPRGTFEMGDSQGDMPEQMMNRPVHRVTISNFEMSKNEVTVEQYAVFIRATNHTRPTNWEIQIKFPKRPVVFVSWDDAVTFASWVGGRLPTEAEWEYAARGGIKGAMYPWGNSSSANRANYNKEWDGGKGFVRHLQDVGSYPSNKFGLNDMVGNVYEWCHDWFGPYSDGLTANPAGPGSSNYGRIVRGGGWNSGAQIIRNSVRGPRNPADKLPHTGFRVVRGRPLN